MTLDTGPNMKIISWERMNEPKDDDETPEELPGLGGAIFQTSSFSPNVNNYEDFNFFIAHCNFYVTMQMGVVISTIEGVEALDLLSPYRFRVAVAKLFEPQQVLDLIRDTITKE